ncbi:MAG: helix-turn-helix domain-containing protein [Terrimicrobiaceae bacterium]
MPDTLSQPLEPPLESFAEDSLLQSLMVALEKETGMQMSFDDLTGSETGFHVDVKPMRLDWAHQTHGPCGFCAYAQRNPRGNLDCVLNKLVVNRLVMRRKEGLEGYCHLGLFDIAEPLIYEGRVLGVFFFGSVRVRGHDALARKKIRDYCKRRKMDPEPYLQEMANVPVISAESIPRHRESLRAVVRLAHYLCEAAGLQADVYRNRKLRYPYQDPQTLPYVVKEAMRYIAAHVDESFIVKDIAGHLRCHPDFLSRKFKQHMGIDLSAYLQQTRIDRAKNLLENPKMDIGTAADLAGFSDRVHFSKVFRRLTGMTPGQYKREAETPRAR